MDKKKDLIQMLEKIQNPNHLAAITEHIEAQRKYWGFKVVRMDQYLFCNENGDPISRERIQGEIDRIIKRIKSDGYDFPRITSHGRVIIRTS